MVPTSVVITELTMTTMKTDAGLLLFKCLNVLNETFNSRKFLFLDMGNFYLVTWSFQEQIHVINECRLCRSLIEFHL